MHRLSDKDNILMVCELSEQVGAELCTPVSAPVTVNSVSRY